MPEINCHHGCSMSISTDLWIASLTIDQLRYTCKAMGQKIIVVEVAPKCTVWRVCRGGFCEEDYEKAAEHLLRIYKERFMSEAADWIDKPRGYLNFERDLTHITPERVSQLEYDTEWFPAKSWPNS